jgi:hypothetical protein
MSKLFANISFSSVNAVLAGGSMFPLILVCLLFEVVPLLAQHAGWLCKTGRRLRGSLRPGYLRIGARSEATATTQGQARPWTIDAAGVRRFW